MEIQKKDCQSLGDRSPESSQVDAELISCGQDFFQSIRSRTDNDGKMIDLQQLSDTELTVRLKILVVNERRYLTALLAHLAEFDRRRLQEKQGYPTLFVYCTKQLGYSEDAAVFRITAARAAQKFPSILGRVNQGRITLTAVVLLSRHLTSENHRSLLDQAKGKSRREVEFMVAALAPKPEVADCVRRMPAPGGQPIGAFSMAEPTEPSLDQPLSPRNPDTPTVASPQTARQSIEPLTPQRVHFGFTGGLELLKLLERARDVLWHKYPAGKLEDIFKEALEFLLDKKDPQRRLEIKQNLKRPLAPIHELNESRRIPQRVKDEVWMRDGGQCTYRRPDATRCSERRGLEFDHRVPFALGGPSNNADNIRLLCRAHNQMTARRVFGDAAVKNRGTESRRGTGSNPGS